MNKLNYSPEAKNDLLNPEAAKNVASKITRRIRRLEQFAEIGTPLYSIINIETDYRFLVCGNYLAFYRIEKNRVNIIRVLYSKRDYSTILFGNLISDEDGE